MFEEEILKLGFVVSIPNQSYKLEINQITFRYIIESGHTWYEYFGDGISLTNTSREYFIDMIRNQISNRRDRKIDSVLYSVLF